MSLIPLFYVSIIAIPLAIIDIREHRLPNRLTLSAVVITFCCLVLAAAISGDWLKLLVASSIAVGTFLIGWWLAAKGGIGMGDVKLLVSLNAIAGYLSPLLPLFAMTAGFVLATAISGIRIVLKKLNPKGAIALGPYLLIGFFLTVLPVAFTTTAEAWS